MRPLPVSLDGKVTVRVSRTCQPFAGHQHGAETDAKSSAATRFQNDPMQSIFTMTKQCGAKTRRGEPCKSRTMPNGRCRMHGGTNRGGASGNSNAVTHGIYRKALSAEEEALCSRIELGTVDHELNLTRIRLARELAAEHAAGGGVEFDSLTENDGGAVPREVRTSKVHDYYRSVDKLVARIESLEKTRMLLGGGRPSNDAADGFETAAYD